MWSICLVAASHSKDVCLLFCAYYVPLNYFAPSAIYKLPVNMPNMAPKAAKQVAALLPVDIMTLPKSFKHGEEAYNASPFII